MRPLGSYLSLPFLLEFRTITPIAAVRWTSCHRSWPGPVVPYPHMDPLPRAMGTTRTDAVAWRLSTVPASLIRQTGTVAVRIRRPSARFGDSESECPRRQGPQLRWKSASNVPHTRSARSQFHRQGFRAFGFALHPPGKFVARPNGTGYSFPNGVCPPVGANGQSAVTSLSLPAGTHSESMRFSRRT